MTEFFDTIKTTFSEYLVIANLEGSQRTKRAPPAKKAVRLELAKFTQADMPDNLLFSLVNNHVTDFGIDNFNENLQLLEPKVAISTQREPVDIVAGTRMLFLADPKEQCVLKGTGFLEFSRKSILSQHHEICGAIVIVHGGIENREYPTVYQRELARLLIDLRAQAVIFHHSHTVGHFETWRGKLIHYGLGNAYFSDTLNLHQLEDSRSHAIHIDEREISIRAYVKLRPSKDCIAEEKKCMDSLSTRNYRKFYKSRYKLDGSLRPRQLYSSDLIIKAQYFLWSFFATLLVKAELSKRVKKNLGKIFPVSRDRS